MTTHEKVQAEIQTLRTRLYGRGEVPPSVKRAREALLRAAMLAPLNPEMAQRHIDLVKNQIAA